MIVLILDGFQKSKQPKAGPFLTGPEPYKAFFFFFFFSFLTNKKAFLFFRIEQEKKNNNLKLD